MECERCFRRLLRARRERPRRRTAEKRDELAASYVKHGSSPALMRARAVVTST